VTAAELPDQVYVKKATWAETIIATRANCAEWAKGQKEGQLTGTPLPAVWRKIQADWPTHGAWFRQDLRGVRYLDWFLQTGNTHFERWIMSQTAPRIGVASEPLMEELTELQNAKKDSNDPRWLEVFARARRLEETLSVTRQLWLGELRNAFEQQAADMIRSQLPSEDARWDALKRWAGKCVDRGAVAHVGSVSELKAAVESLTAAMPERFSGGEAFLDRLADAEPKWNATIASLLAQDPKTLGKLPTLHSEVQAFRQSLLLAIRGMPEFLNAWSSVDLPTDWEGQYAALTHDLADRARFDGIAAEVFRPESLVLPEDRDPADIVLRRTAALLADLRSTTAAPKLVAFEKELAALDKASIAVPPENVEARYVLFADACRLRREIAFSNPLLDFDKLLFIKRHLAIYNHMCDQYYGITARPGGALCVLGNPFRPDASIRDLLADSVIERGRLRGEKIGGGPNQAWKLRYNGVGSLSGDETEGGSFLSPDVSFDGTEIAFAYVECSGEREHRSHTDPSRGHWPEGRCFHIFKVRADGSHLEQLTDGTWNDFDPCWMPSGRIAFTSERRGGYLRCGRVCPTYTLYDMAADGSGIRCLSYHETNEWHPSVAHDGRIVWTRWDYVDRQGCHEPRPGTPSQSLPSDLLAMRRAPSRLQPDVDGTNPFSYPRLVQPVLDKHCVESHAKDPDKAPRLDAELVTHPGGGWMNRQTVYYASYLSLAPKYGFYDYGGSGWTDPKWYRTTPGEFGARASKLYQMLTDGHHDVKLSPKELQRIAVWLGPENAALASSPALQGFLRWLVSYRRGASDEERLAGQHHRATKHGGIMTRPPIVHRGPGQRFPGPRRFRLVFVSPIVPC